MLDQYDPTYPSAPPLAPTALRAEISRRAVAYYTSPPFDEVFRRESELHERHDIVALAQVPLFPGFLNRIKAACKRKLAGLLHWVFQRQVEFNGAVALHACETLRIVGTQDANISELFTSLTALRQDVDRLEDRLRHADARIVELEEELLTTRHPSRLRGT